MTEDEKTVIAASILDLISEATLSHPDFEKLGWETVAKITGFQEKAMAMTGNAAPDFVPCLEAVGLTRDDAVNAFLKAKQKAKQAAMAPTHKKGSKNNAQPVDIKPISPKPGSVVFPEPPRGPVSPEARPDANRTGDEAAVAGPVGKPGGDPGVRRSVHRDKKPEPVASPEKQSSLF